ncbi:MAG: hypothetical protein KGJ64_07940 [Betaproteobacteria bacterium]|nr:hypothetical protein [Betaproteobacteria bacterium]
MGPWVPSLIVDLAVAAAGTLAHARLRRTLPPAALPAPGSMHAAMLGMLLGLAIDASSGRLELLASLCGGDLPLGPLLRWHLGLLPASNAGLALVGVLPLLWRVRAGASEPRSRRCLLPTLLVLGLTLAGMNLGMPLLLHATGVRVAAPGLPAMLAAMQAGMAWGAALALGLLWLLRPLRAAARAPAAAANAPNPRA